MALKRHNRPRPWGPALLGLALSLAACTALAPMQKPEQDRLFPKSRKSNGGHAPCIAPPNQPQACDKLEDNLEDFAGDLGHVLWELDERRRELVGYVVDHGNLTSVYNALLWPAGAYVLNKKYADRSWSARDAIVVAAASWGLMNSGVPERDRIYLDAADQILCLIVKTDPDLYLKNPLERVVDYEWASVSSQGGNPQTSSGRITASAYQSSLHRSLIPHRIKDLEAALNQFERQRDLLLLDMETLPPPGAATPAGEVDRRRQQATGRGTSTPAAPASPVADITRITRIMVENTRAELRKLRALQTHVEGSGKRLRLRRSFLETAQVRGLSERVELKNPFDVAKELNGLITLQRAAEQRLADSLAQAHSGGSASDKDWLPTPDKLKALKDPKRVRDFWVGAVATLRTARQPGQEWLAGDQQRRKDAAQAALDMGCDGGSLAAFAQTLLKASTPPAPPVPSSGASAPGTPTPSQEPL